MAVTVAAPGTQRTLLENISWETYGRLLAEQGDRSAPRISYDRGLLEIVTLGREHETANRSIARLVWFVATEVGVDVVDVGSMTYRRAMLQRGVEPDSSFYVRHAEVVRRDDFDVSVDPPPDLVIEVDASRSSLNKLDLYFHLGVPEVWIWEAGQAKFYVRGDERFDEVGQSRVLPFFTAEIVTKFTAESLTLSNIEWYRAVIAWARAQ